MHVQVMDHPLIQHKITLMRKKETGSKDFRNLLEEITMLMGYEITRDLPLENVAIETPVATMTGKQISGKKLGIVPVLRAGLGMVQGMLNLIPMAKVGHIASIATRRLWNRLNITANCLMLKTATSSLSIPCWLPAAVLRQPLPCSRIRVSRTLSLCAW